MYSAFSQVKPSLKLSCWSPGVLLSPVDDLLGSKEEAMDGARGVLSGCMVADNSRLGCACVHVLPLPVLVVVRWPVNLAGLSVVMLSRHQTHVECIRLYTYVAEAVCRSLPPLF